MSHWQGPHLHKSLHKSLHTQPQQQSKQQQIPQQSQSHLQQSSQSPLYLIIPTNLFSGLIFTSKNVEQKLQQLQFFSLTISTDSEPKLDDNWSNDGILKLLQ
jgi:hypothetical protein